MVPQTVTDEEEIDEETDGESILTVDLPTSNGFFPNSHLLSNFQYHCSELENSFCKDIKSLLSKYPEITADRPGLCTIISHDISLTEECKAPIRLAPYKLNPAKTAILKQEVQYLLDYHLAEPSISPWAAPCLLVPKPDHSYRMCTDYRKLNEVTARDCCIPG
ncbi:hypothetical protein Pcinc_004528 [Petrolisthes cinctipes]|uniref:Gag-pol polyprotein n=1 Tax=Petrolisthes cinctipes TaxID=88211 RepID=A0AAE1GGP4_PETCI|nr:hypothetical protein Pcinc_004528 [Petrolisthes cinctipes]